MTSLLQYTIHFAESPFWTFAIHNGHKLDPVVHPFIQLGEKQRLREEDPYTACIAALSVNQLYVDTSRFQLDVNRREEDAVYIEPEQAWGLEVWRQPIPNSILQQLYADYRLFYRRIDDVIEQTINKHRFFIIFDVHSYNARRRSETQAIDKQTNPQINLGSYYNKPKWQSIIKIFIESVQRQRLLGKPIDIRENIKFRGGYLAQHIIAKFGENGCVLSIELRKDFMNEWSGTPDKKAISEYKKLLHHTLRDLQKTTTYGI